jgi:hypothetical protein
MTTTDHQRPRPTFRRSLKIVSYSGTPRSETKSLVTQARIKEGTGDDLVEVPLRILSGIVSSTARTATTSQSIFGYFLISGARLILYPP